MKLSLILKILHWAGYTNTIPTLPLLTVNALIKQIRAKYSFQHFPKSLTPQIATHIPKPINKPSMLALALNNNSIFCGLLQEVLYRKPKKRPVTWQK